MNFPPFSGHFSTAIPTIHQFAAKFQDATSLCPTEPSNNRYTANGVPSFTQHHPATQQQILAASTAKYPTGNYQMNQTVYGNSSAVRQEKRASVYEQDLAQELCSVMLQQDKQHNTEKVSHFL